MSLLVEIRCCCDPNLLLGHVVLDRDSVREGEIISFPLRIEVSLKPMWLQADEDPFVVAPREVLRLPVAVATVLDRVNSRYAHLLAIKSNDTPIEKLRRIQGFTEAPR